ncbi:MAG: hypothetical protein HN337_05925 [Deltaproteobacteria bacterium]|jgi:hypothetical protein|nr:hypothetical protein [Deltaproteobacteria bacterium]
MKLSMRISLLFFTTFLSWGIACSGDIKSSSLEGNLLDYNEGNTVTFTISGNATCKKCEDDEIPIEGMQIEVYAKDGPIDRLGLKVYGGLGNFTMKNVQAHAGQTLEVEGKLMRDGTSGWVTAAYGYAEVVAPEEDGKVVALTLRFPSSDDDYDDDDD